MHFLFFSVNMPDPILKHFGYGHYGQNQPAGFWQNATSPLPVYQFQFQTQLCSSIDSWKTSLDPIWFWLTESGFGQMDLVQKQASVQESLGLFLANNSKPVGNPQHVYILQGLCSMEMECWSVTKIIALNLSDWLIKFHNLVFLLSFKISQSPNQSIMGTTHIFAAPAVLPAAVPEPALKFNAVFRVLGESRCSWKEQRWRQISISNKNINNTDLYTHTKIHQINASFI